MRSRSHLWKFDDESDMVAFVLGLPESAAKDLKLRKSLQWQTADDKSRADLLRQLQMNLKNALLDPLSDGRASWFRALQVADEGESSIVRSNPGYEGCNEIWIEVTKSRIGEQGRDFCIQLSGVRAAMKDVDEFDEGIWKISRDQSLRLAERLIAAATLIEKKSARE